MKSLSVSALAALSISSMQAADDYQPGPDSNPREGVPKGEVTKYSFEGSKIFPGTTRDFWVYVPSQYDPEMPACVFVNQDGIQNNAPVVFDNLIASCEMPITIGVFVTPGRVKAPNNEALDRFNRSYEYDGLGDAYARFILDELLPEVQKKTTSDGRPIRLSSKGNDRAVAGSSSGAIAAFTAAWEQPSSFSRVYSSIGTYVGLRGGNVYPTLIRKFEPKPIRIFLQDGSADQNIYGGDWWMANQEMERALTFAGYEVNHVWGDGGHNGKQSAAIFPDAMRWLWKGWPAPVKTGTGSAPLKEILIPGEEWQLVGEGYKAAEGMAANAQGEMFFTDVPESKIYRVDADGRPAVFVSDSKRGLGQAFGPNGALYSVAGGDEKVVSYAEGKNTAADLAGGFRGNDLVVLNNGNLYVTEPGWEGSKPSNIWLIRPNGEERVVDTGLNFSNGVVVSPDQTLLYVDDSRSHWVYSYQIQPDGSLAHKQRYYHLHSPDTADDSGADGMEVDRDGRLYVATRLGIQVCDQAGRVNCIIPTPNGKVASLSFGGCDFDTLFATCGDKVFKRKLKVKGALSFLPPIKPAAPRL
ncbi:MAG: gluconolactonase [Chthoniobacteraceae bacterium]|nr:gluconolactonase [Chthoniobacteraceae bacterium]